MLSIIDLPSSKAEMYSVASAAIENFLSGDHDIMALELRLKVMQDCIDTIRKNQEVKNAVIKEAAKYANNTYNVDVQTPPAIAPGLGNMASDHLAFSNAQTPLCTDISG